jgi:antitoxin component YwqK of YwqJK toxin-antitoxin module
MITYAVKVNEYKTKRWYLNGKLHCEDGPAIEYADGTKSWHLNGKLHREDGPAIEWADGSKSWYLNGKLHREDGAAIEVADGTKYWYLEGKELTEKEFNAAKKKITITIDGVTYKLVKEL